MDIVYKAFTNFLAINRRLPCPAVITVAKGASGYGNEAATPGTCASTYVSSTNAPNLSYGMVPINALGLDPDMAEDGWGTKFTYVVDKRFTKQSASTSSTDGFEISKGTPAEVDTTSTDLLGIDPQNPSGTSIFSNKNGTLLLISHGANRFNGFNATGIAQNGTGVTDENANSCNPCSTTGTTSYNRVFIVGSNDANYDDIALYKTKSQLVRDAGMEFIMCSYAEAQTASYSWLSTNNGAYGCNTCSTTLNKQKTCGKYGVWSALSSNTCTANTSTCTASTNTVHAFLAYKTVTNQSIPASTVTKITLNTVSYDTDSWFSTGTSRYTPQIAGYYMFVGSVISGNGASSWYLPYIYKNGAAVMLGNNFQTSAGGGPNSQVVFMVYMNGSTDYVELWFYAQIAETVYASFVTMLQGYLIQ